MNTRAWNILTDQGFSNTVEAISGNNPQNILLSGGVPATRRGLALAMAEELVRRNRLAFSGTSTHFSLTVPPLTTTQEVSSFLERLMQCVCIAAGYFCIFRGVVILECEGVIDSGCCSELVRYIRYNEANICFILYSAGDERQSDSLWQIFGSPRQWQRLSICQPSPGLLCNLLAALALSKGVRLTPDSRSALEELMPQSSLEKQDLVELAESMVGELSSSGWDCPVTALQIRQLSIPIPPRQRRVIGFAPR